MEDEFFKMSEMERFLEMGDAAEEKRRIREDKGLEDKDEDDADGVDYFEADSGDEGDERSKYADYFGVGDRAKPKENEEEDENDEEEEDEENDKEAIDNNGLKDLLADSDDDDEEKEEAKEAKSAFEERQSRLKKKIGIMEEEAVGDKPWQLTGEIAGPARPENSLLQEHVEYDTVARAAPIITEEVSRTLEQIILRRIGDRAWDDVERKVRLV